MGQAVGGRAREPAGVHKLRFWKRAAEIGGKEVSLRVCTSRTCGCSNRWRASRSRTFGYAHSRDPGAIGHPRACGEGALLAVTPVSPVSLRPSPFVTRRRGQVSPCHSEAAATSRSRGISVRGAKRWEHPQVRLVQSASVAARAIRRRPFLKPKTLSERTYRRREAVGAPAGATCAERECRGPCETSATFPKNENSERPHL
jgi:hypothetical protein